MAGSEQASPPSLSVFFPAYNDSGTIASLVITALKTAAKLTPNYEVIVVNDGSTDSTAQILDELARVYPQLRIVTHTVNRGYGGALRSGFASALVKQRIWLPQGNDGKRKLASSALHPDIGAHGIFRL